MSDRAVDVTGIVIYILVATFRVTAEAKITANLKFLLRHIQVGGPDVHILRMSLLVLLLPHRAASGGERDVQYSAAA